MEQKSNRPVDWEAFVLRYEAKLYRTALAILGSPQEAEDAVKDDKGWLDLNELKLLMIQQGSL